jgi:peptidyl-tRNA hydrolase
MYCIYSKEAVDLMKGNRGKLAAMAGHAYLHAFWEAEKLIGDNSYLYKYGGLAKKIALVVPTTEELIDLHQRLIDMNTQFNERAGLSLVTDAGRTCFDGPTTVCLGVGPVYEDSLVSNYLKDIKMFL